MVLLSVWRGPEVAMLVWNQSMMLMMVFRLSFCRLGFSFPCLTASSCSATHCWRACTSPVDRAPKPLGSRFEDWVRSRQRAVTLWSRVHFILRTAILPLGHLFLSIDSDQSEFLPGRAADAAMERGLPRIPGHFSPQIHNADSTTRRTYSPYVECGASWPVGDKLRNGKAEIHA